MMVPFQELDPPYRHMSLDWSGIRGKMTNVRGKWSKVGPSSNHQPTLLIAE